MRLRLLLLTLSLLLFCDGFSQELSGIFAGAYSCNGAKPRQYELKILHVRTYRALLTLSEYNSDKDREPAGTAYFTTLVGAGGFIATISMDSIKGSFANAALLNGFILNAYVGSVSLTIRGMSCGLTMSEDKRQSKQFLSALKKQREQYLKHVSRHPEDIDINVLKGSWEGRFGRISSFCRLVADQDNVWLELNLQNEIKSMQLQKAAEEEGGVVFNLPREYIEVLQFEQVKATFLDAHLIGGKPSVALVPIRKDKKFIEGGNLQQVENTGTGITRIFREASERQSYLYFDWQQKDLPGYHLPDDTAATQRLRKAFDKLYSNGWRCLAQETRMISHRNQATIAVQEGATTKLYLVYCPLGDSLLTFSMTSSPTSMALLDTRSNDYPVIQSGQSTFSDHNAKFIFRLRSHFSLPIQSARAIPVTLFVFGNTADRGSGCSFTPSKEVLDQILLNRTITRLALVFLLEKGRQVSHETKSHIQELLYGKGRDAVIKSILRDYFTAATEEELDIYTKLSVMVMTGEADLAGLARDLVKGKIVDEAKLKYPKYEVAIEVSDFLCELAILKYNW